ncbi:N-acetylglucosaminyl-diphospho-decaprenol L-rhamnosyltransferase [Calidithermus terrae]|uniref:N-acetylglucosaminyl-diphospho-decaprenol L-rhamnosyltransferase n=1 Tax=Calidithermus terrae TaxID=1408545 RepID=A0A399ENA2_9DEIN|nr:N-acetylglucosaminyl-diphospho-decaprenol L-rhamnosyltransferase [Calidithermus terrae]
MACISSLRAIDYPNYRILVVDNGSMDGSVHEIRTAAPDVTVVSTGVNLGFAGGNNVGIRSAVEQGAEYVWLLNNDTVVDKGALSALVEVAESDGAIGAVGSVLYYLDQPERIQAYGGGKVSLWIGYSRHYTNMESSRMDYLVAASLLVRRIAFEKVGLLDDGYFMYWEDTDFSFRLRKAGWKLAVATNSKVLHKESASMGKKSPTLDRYFNKSARRFFTRHAPLPLLPVVLGVGGRFIKRVLQGDWDRALATLQGGLSRG